MESYYEKKLSSNRLKKVYDLATPRILQYLQAELGYALEHISGGDLVLDLGCGYGRQLPEMCKKAGFVVGIDSSADSLSLGMEFLKDVRNCVLVRMNARDLEFPDESFNVVTCLQNGISAFHVDQHDLIREAIRVTRPGGKILFSSYSEKIWEERLKWFELQSDAGLLGKIDPKKTGKGNIVCDDGFTATTVGESDFRELLSGIPGIEATLREVDGSCLFLVITRSVLPCR